MLSSEHLFMSFAGPISHTSKQCMDFVEFFTVLLNSFSINFARFYLCRVSFVCSCYSILECYNLFSGVKLSIRSSLIISVNMDLRLHAKIHKNLIKTSREQTT